MLNRHLGSGAEIAVFAREIPGGTFLKAICFLHNVGTYQAIACECALMSDSDNWHWSFTANSD
jgi:hypothetical protein